VIRKKEKLSLRKQPNQERAYSTMEDILKATAHILEKEGFEKASTNKIAAKAGVSIGSLYQYFPTKDSIVALMMDRFMKHEMEIFNQVLAEKNAKNLEQTIRAIIEAMMASKRKNRRFTKIFAQKIFGFNKFEMLKKVDDYLLELFKIHIEPFAHEIRKDNLEMSLWMIMQAVKLIPVTLIFDERYDLDDPRVVDELVHMTYSYLKQA
jgi:AcrR family transcriptional regulator